METKVCGLRAAGRKWVVRIVGRFISSHTHTEN